MTDRDATVRRWRGLSHGKEWEQRRMPTKTALRDWLGFPSTRVAIAVTIVGILFILLELLSPSKLYWTGQAVEGVDSGGIIYNQVRGQEYTVDDTRRARAAEGKVTVYVDPVDPSQALVQNPTRWIDAIAVLVWFVAAAALLIVSALRRRFSPPAFNPEPVMSRRL